MKKTYTYMMTAEYCKDWQIKDAIREVLANALDTKTAVEAKWENLVGTVVDHGDGMSTKALLIGASTKGSNEIGQFGEGLKVAALVFSRAKRGFSVRANGTEFSFSMKHNEDFGTEVLVVDIEQVQESFPGTKVVFHCSEEEFNEAKNMFLVFNGRKSIDKDILDAPGEVYVMGLLTQKVKALFGYNLKNKSMMNRDRTVLDGGAMNTAIVKLVAVTKNEVVIDKYLKCSVDPEYRNCVEYYGYFLPRGDDKERWLKAAKKTWGSRICLSSGAADGRAEYLGYKVINVGWSVSSLLEHCGVKTSTVVAPKPEPKTKNVKQTDLELDEAKTLESIKKIAKKVEPRTGWWVQVVDKFEDRGGDQQENRIRIPKTSLKDLPVATGTMLHELAHWSSGGLDVSKEFEARLTKYLGILGSMVIVSGGRRQRSPTVQE